MNENNYSRQEAYFKVYSCREFFCVYYILLLFRSYALYLYERTLRKILNGNS